MYKTSKACHCYRRKFRVSLCSTLLLAVYLDGLVMINIFICSKPYTKTTKATYFCFLYIMIVLQTCLITHFLFGIIHDSELPSKATQSTYAITFSETTDRLKIICL